MGCLVGGWLAAAALAPAQVPAATAEESPRGEATTGESLSADDWFVDSTTTSGLDYVHFNGMSGEMYFSEIVGPGVGLLDYDGDGDLDIFIPQGSMLGEGKTIDDATFPVPQGSALGDRLFRNDTVIKADGTRGVHFVDVTLAAGLRGLGYGMGVAVGDYTGNGFPDLYVTNFGRNDLWRNEGDGTFEEVAAVAGVADDRWSISATFFDYDRDGHLDLFVADYVDFSINTHKPCFSTSSARDYCGPRSYNPVPARLYHNDGKGGFEDVSARSGIAAEFGGALGVVAADFDEDGWPDIYVANDQSPNQLWINQRDGHFVDDAFLAGIAVNMDGAPEASMGVDAGDIDGDGDEDLILSHLNRQSNTLYINEGGGLFSDQTLQAGLAAPSFPYTGFGAGWLDFDSDGALDFLVVNGEVQVIGALALEGDQFPLHQQNQLYRNLGDGKFEEVSARAGAAFELSEVSRGAAFGDVDNDGDGDVLVTANQGPARWLENRYSAGGRSWLGVVSRSPYGATSLGTRVRVDRGKAGSVWRRSRADGSYASANDPRILVGLGEVEASALVLTWPSGAVQRFNAPAGRNYWVVSPR
ncbi:MAG: CRTAC1 family protein [Thermoanaerobaculia bacterium]|nr:CRTAC1 family protein [Thermoanaerobaculia bacterium]